MRQSLWQLGLSTYETLGRPPSARPVIPKRGEKEFEPRSGGGTNLQLHVLDRSRLAMFDTLRATRTISKCACPRIPRIQSNTTLLVKWSAMLFGIQLSQEPMSPTLVVSISQTWDTLHLDRFKRQTAHQKCKND